MFSNRCVRCSDRGVLGMKFCTSTTKMFIYFLILVMVFCSDHVQSRPQAHSRVRREFISDKVQHYLMKYGYLPMSDMETGNLRTEVQLREAIKVMQRFGHIPQSGVLDAKTLALLEKRRCSLPDVQPPTIPDPRQNEIYRRSKRFVKQGNRWEKYNLTWGIRRYPDAIRDNTGNQKHLSRWEIQREFRLATAVWGRASRLIFTEIEDEPDRADIIIDFSKGYHGDGYPFDGPGRILAHAFYPGNGIGGDMHFDKEEPWVQHKDANRSYEEISLFITAAHELGHSLGLYHSDVEGALMSPYLLSFPQDFTLPVDDTRGIQELYGEGDDYRPPERERPTHPPETTNEDTNSDSEETYPTPRPPLNPPPKTGTERPDTCDTEYDAISVIRREIYIFKGKYFWRSDGRGRPNPNYPAPVERFWPMLPKNLTAIDAVYERPQDGNIVFFIGSRYYVCRGNDKLVETGPLKRLGLPDDLAKIDAAFVWGHNGRTYFFSDTMYWRYDESEGKVELDYPRDMSIWKGVPYNIESALKYNGTAYFFKGKVFYEFDDLRMNATPKSPYQSSSFWFNCPNSFKNSYYQKKHSEVKNLASSASSLYVRPKAIDKIGKTFTLVPYIDVHFTLMLKLILSCVIILGHYKNTHQKWFWFD